MSGSIVSFSLRIVYMLFSLLLIRYTFGVFSDVQFRYLNEFLFFLSLSIFFYYPLTVDLWKKKIAECKVSILLLTGILVLYYAVVSVVILGSFNWFFTFSVVLLGVARFQERLFFVSCITRKKYITAYVMIFILLFLELLSVFIIDYIAPIYSLRYFIPGLSAVIVLVYAATIIKKEEFNTTNERKLDYFTSQNLGLVVYVSLLTLFVAGDRFLAKNVFQDQLLSEYLLVLSYSLACQTLFSVIVDAMRPNIVENKGFLDQAKCCFILAVFFLCLTILGYDLLLYLNLVPAGKHLIWMLQLATFLLCSFMNVIQIREQAEKNISKIIPFWFFLVVIKTTVFIFAEQFELNIHQVLLVIFISTLVVFCIKLFMVLISEKRKNYLFG